MAQRLSVTFSINHKAQPLTIVLPGTFEPCPADFSFLLMQETPPHGGDTLWCSGYELYILSSLTILFHPDTPSYDRISPSFRSYLETLTATCAQPVFKTAADAGGYEIMSPRGAPSNTGDSFAPSHPVIRTNRVTGWKSVFAGMGLHVSRINDVYSYEDQFIRDYMMRLLTRNHDCIARMHWTKHSAAIWNNSCTFHAATVWNLSITLFISASVDMLTANSPTLTWCLAAYVLVSALRPLVNART